MIPSPPIRLVSSLALTLALASPTHAAPPDGKTVCFDAYPEAQKHRKAGKLRAAQKELVICSQDACPAAVRRDCAQWLGEVTGELPSVLVVATDPEGKDTAAVRVTVDGSS